jgi:hypothetical protein
MHYNCRVKFNFDSYRFCILTAWHTHLGNRCQIVTLKFSDQERVNLNQINSFQFSIILEYDIEFFGYWFQTFLWAVVLAFQVSNISEERNPQPHSCKYLKTCTNSIIQKHFLIANLLQNTRKTDLWIYEDVCTEIAKTGPLNSFHNFPSLQRVFLYSPSVTTFRFVLKNA